MSLIETTPRAESLPLAETATAPRTLITGASAGIGADIARGLAAEGRDLVLVARRADRLRDLARELRERHDVLVLTLAQDLSQPKAHLTLQEHCRERNIVVETLVNNAGFGLNGTFAELDLEQQQQMVQLNIMALMNLTGTFLPIMLKRGKGQILNVASTAGFQPGPRMAVYYATKAFVLSFTEALHEELKDHPVSVSALCPGPTHSEFMTVAGMEDSPLFTKLAASSASVAKAGIAGLRRNRSVVVPGFMNKMGTLLVRLSPRILTRKVVKSLQ